MSTEPADHKNESSGASSVPGVVREIFGNKGFVACVLLLASFAVAFQVLASYRNIKFRKLPLPLKKSLSLLDSKKLAPYAIYHAQEIKGELLDALGTDQYIQWILKDESRTGPSRPEDYIHLFVTYYTGQPDQVPHVPEVCYMGGGGYHVKQSSIVDIPIPALGAEFTVPVQVLELERSSFIGVETKIVIYTFHANGQFLAHRRSVQQTVGNPYDTYAYFSKLELAFGIQKAQPSKERAIAAAERFLNKVIPVLVEDHWPDWDQAVRDAESSSSSTERTDASDVGQ